MILRTVAGDYQQEDVYNMDESWLYYRMTPSSGLAGQPLARRKRQKDQISLVLCSNASGYDKLPIWFIGKVKQPQCLQNLDLPQMGAHWRANGKAWINPNIMSQWLRAFYQHIGPHRNVLLTMDNFLAHQWGIDIAPPPDNVRIIILPPNSISKFQPLEQGVIRTFKQYYRKYLLQHMLDCYKRNTDPLDEINIYLAIKWSIIAWNLPVHTITITNCFRRSCLVSQCSGLPTPLDSINVSSLYGKVCRAGKFQDAMAIANFLNPKKEDETPDPLQWAAVTEEGQMDQSLAERLDTGPEEHAEEPIGPTKPEVSMAEAQAATRTLINYAEGNEAIKPDDYKALLFLELKLSRIAANYEI